MLIFVKIVLAVVLVIAVAIVGCIWWFKRALMRATGDHVEAVKLLNPDRLRPARTKLHSTKELELEFNDEALALWDTVRSLGFRQLADFNCDQMMRVGQHVSLPLLAAVLEDYSGNAFFVCLAAGADRSLSIVTTEATSSLQIGKMNWHAQPDWTPAQAIDYLKNQIDGREMLQLNAAQFRSAWEQVHAARMDRILASPPRREQIADEIAQKTKQCPDSLIDTAFELARSHWTGAVADAALDHFRRDSKLDAVTWENIEHSVHVVHGQLSDEDIEELLIDDDLGEQLLQQFKDQGLSGIDLYEQIRSRLPIHADRAQIGEVTRPLRALIYAPGETSTDSTVGQFMYSASDQGETVHGSVAAATSGDAKRQLANMGLSQVAILSDPAPLTGEDELDWSDPATARLVAQSSQVPLAVSAVRAVVANIWIWGPPAGLLAWTLYEGAPFHFSDYAIFAYAILAAVVMLFLIGPMIVYDLFTRARTIGRWRTGLFLHSVLSRINLLSRVDKRVMLLDRLKVMAGQGKDQAVLEVWAAQQTEMSEADYQGGLTMLYDAMGDHERMIGAQRATVQARPEGNDLASVDLALSLARHGNTDEAEALLGEIARENLSELVAVGYYHALGLVSARRDDHERALPLYARAIERTESYKSNAWIWLFIAEIKACAAISLKANGDAEQASTLWQQCWPLLRVHRGTEWLETRYNAS